MAERADSTPTKSIERVCLSPSSKEQICLLCAKVVSNNDFRRKLMTSGKKKLVSISSQYWERKFHNQEILDIRTHFKPTETFQYTHFSSCNPHGVRTNSSAKSFYENIYNFKKRLRARGYPHNLIRKITSEVTFTERKSALQKNNEVRKKIRISLGFWATELDTRLSSSICQPASICRYRARGLSPFRGDKVKMVIELDDLSSSMTCRAR